MTGGPEGLRGLCSIKAVTEDRFFKWVRTSIPVPVGKSHHCYVCTSFDPCSVLSRLSSTGAQYKLGLFEGSCGVGIWGWPVGEGQGAARTCQGGDRLITSGKR